MTRMPSPVSRRLLRRGLIAVAVIAVVAGAIAAFVLLHAPGNVSNPSVAFNPPTTTAPPPPPPRKHHRRNNFQWPWYGYNAGRTRLFASAPDMHPPFHIGWALNEGTLLEFPPVIYHETLFFMGDNAVVRAINIHNGRTRWSAQSGDACGRLAGGLGQDRARDGARAVDARQLSGQWSVRGTFDEDRSDRLAASAAGG